MNDVLRWALVLVSLSNLGGMLAVFTLYSERHHGGTHWWIMHLPAHVWMMAVGVGVFIACGVGVAFAGVGHPVHWFGAPGFVLGNVFVAAGLRRILRYRRGKAIEASRWGRKRLTDPGGPKV